MLERRLLSVALISTITLLSTRSADADTTFGPGSIILPAGAPYQTDCGAVAIYGVVYQTLRANPWLQANGHGTIELYYGFKDTKLSPNRCTPTNLHAGPPYPSVPSPLHNDVAWNDGCDFEIFSTAPVPVALMTNATATNTATDVASFATRNTVGHPRTFPQWPSKTIADTGVAGTDVDTVRYWGGSFILKDSDAVTFRKLIEGTLIANDVDGNPISFAQFKAGACTFGTSNGGQVNFHVAQVTFTAPTPKTFNAPPPRLALLTDDQLNLTGSIANGVLQKYLLDAGLSFVGAQGCPIGGHLATFVPASCPSPNKTGQIFDSFDIEDVRAGRLLATVAGKPVYQMFWAPHWHANAALNAAETTSINNIAGFADLGYGVMGECASILSWEGVSGDTSATPNGQFMTCANAAGACGGSTAFGVDINIAAPSGSVFPNCSDPQMANGVECHYFSYPGDAFTQTADFMWPVQSGTVADLLPRAGVLYKPGVLPMVSAVVSLDKSKLTDPTTARAMIVSEMAARTVKDNVPAKGNILYLGGHDQTKEVAPTKVVLQTLLQLGAPPIVPTTEEVARSSPIVGVLDLTNNGVADGTTRAIVQGSFDEVTPTPTSTSITFPALPPGPAQDAEAAAFRFPYLIGHLRAVDVGDGSLPAGASIQALPDLLAAGATDGIPAAGCTGVPPPGAAVTGTCRMVFTHTAGGAYPSPVTVKPGDTSLEAAMQITGLSGPNQDIVVSRIVTGFESAPGVFEPRLGGVDRSTTAVIGSSLVVTGAINRHTIIYVGGADGMMHAFCGSLGGACDVLGRELWAFLPRTLLPKLRSNTQRIEGSPRVADVFGDFDNNPATPPKFYTLLFFQTGTGDPSVAGQEPAVYALDVSDPFKPNIIWEQTLPGQGLRVTTGRVQIGAATKNTAFVQTNMGATSGTVVTAINIDNPLAGPVWPAFTYPYPSPQRGLADPVPISGVPEGAVGLDRTGAGRTTDIIVNTLYGDIWQLNASTGVSQYPGLPLFSFTTNRKPFGVSPTIFGDGNKLFTVTVSGGYYDPGALTLWSSVSGQRVIAVDLDIAGNTNGTAPDVTYNETNAAFSKALADNEKGFAQIIVVGTQIFVTTDSADINAVGYGVGADSGMLHTYDLTGTAGGTGGAELGAGIVIAGGAGSIASNTTDIFTSAKDTARKMGTPAVTDVSVSTNANQTPKVSRRLWLRTL